MPSWQQKERIPLIIMTPLANAAPSPANKLRAVMENVLKHVPRNGRAGPPKGVALPNAIAVGSAIERQGERGYTARHRWIATGFAPARARHLLPDSALRSIAA